MNHSKKVSQKIDENSQRFLIEKLKGGMTNMKKIFTLFAFLLFLVVGLFNVATVSAIGDHVGAGLDVELPLGEGLPNVLHCGSEITLGPGGAVIERTGQYAYEGEAVEITALVLHGSGIENIAEVYELVDGDYAAGACEPIGNPFGPEILDACGENYSAEFISGFMEYYSCVYVVGDPVSDYGEEAITIHVLDNWGESAETEPDYWFFNPILALGVDGEILFDETTPGTAGYSETVLVSNEAEAGVVLDMYISGTDFYDPSSSEAMCPDTNQLSLETFSYFAIKGAYSTQDDPRSSPEGFVGIEYGVEFHDPDTFYGTHEVIQAGEYGEHYLANFLSSGEEVATTFRVDVPQFCKGNFEAGQIYFWGEAI